MTILFSISTVSKSKTVQFQIIQLSISTQFKYKYGLIVKKTCLLEAIQFNQKIQFSISMSLVLSGVTTLGQSGSGRNGNEGVLRIPQGPSITGISPSLVSYTGHSLEGGGLTPLQRCSQCILLPQDIYELLTILVQYL